MISLSKGILYVCIVGQMGYIREVSHGVQKLTNATTFWRTNKQGRLVVYENNVMLGAVFSRTTIVSTDFNLLNFGALSLQTTVLSFTLLIVGPIGFGTIGQSYQKYCEIVSEQMNPLEMKIDSWKKIPSCFPCHTHVSS
ncbi:hypothetical protein HOLleu_19348 [Holothuria leucospilota]|uniref:Uncharacterized protein n=1 Tax=Holothuria leucospilota TaxID=206669 RepID=A0A9Q1C032_HOLLE|nr:hypothetical protein HOLleu_19348 [Holothuria leucospilota]